MKKYDVAANIILTCVATLTGALIGLKAAGVVTWAWVWVLAPLWVPVALVLALVHFVLFWVVFYAIIEGVCKALEAVRCKC